MTNTTSTYALFCFLGLVLLNPINLFGQDYRTIELNSLLTSPANYSEVVDEEAVKEIHGLIYDLNPTIFISDSGSSVFGDEAPVKLEFDAGSFQELYTSNPAFNEVKLLAIKIEGPADYSNSLDLSTLPAFQNLKYIFVECAFDCDSTQIQNMFSNVDDVVVLYLVATPE